jgi:hypothetical protein
LVTFVAMLSRAQTIGDASEGSSLSGEVPEVWTLKSRLGAHEVALVVPSTTAARNDALASVARVTGAFVLVGSDRHFVQWRDVEAPYGYDATAPLTLGAGDDLALHHATFTQAYSRASSIELRALAMQARLVADPSSRASSLHGAPLWVTTEPGLLRATASTLARAGASARAGIIELPSSSFVDQKPRRLGLVSIASTPARLVELLTRTLGLVAFRPVAPGVAVEHGWEHPIRLASLPLFAREGLVLLHAPRAERAAPVVLASLPPLVDVASLRAARLEKQAPTTATSIDAPSPIVASLRLVATSRGSGAISALVVKPSHASLLRRLVRAMPAAAIAASSLAHVAVAGERMLVWKSRAPIEAPAIGTPFRALGDDLFVPSGTTLEPDVSTAEIRLLSPFAADATLLLVHAVTDDRDRVRVVAIPADAFVPLARALLSADSWDAVPSTEVRALAIAALDHPIDEEPVAELTMESLGLRALTVRTS